MVQSYLRLSALVQYKNLFAFLVALLLLCFFVLGGDGIFLPKYCRKKKNPKTLQLENLLSKYYIHTGSPIFNGLHLSKAHDPFVISLQKEKKINLMDHVHIRHVTHMSTPRGMLAQVVCTSGMQLEENFF